MSKSIFPFWTKRENKHEDIHCEFKQPVSIAIKNLCVKYSKNTIISNLSCHFEAPGLYAIAGPNGAGKTTFLKTLLGLQKPKEGTINFHGFCPCDVAYLAQQNQLDRRFPFTVGDTIAMGLFREVGIFRKYGKDQKERMQQALEQVGLKAFAHTPLQALSGGQFQRVLFARLILQNAPVIFLDEPFSAVDGRTIEDLVKLLQSWVAQGRLVVAVLHDLDLVRDYFPKTLLLARRFYKSGSTSKVLTKANLREAVAASRLWEAEAGT